MEALEIGETSERARWHHAHMDRPHTSIVAAAEVAVAVAVQVRPRYMELAGVVPLVVVADAVRAERSALQVMPVQQVLEANQKQPLEQEISLEPQAVQLEPKAALGQSIFRL